MLTNLQSLNFCELRYSQIRLIHLLKQCLELFFSTFCEQSQLTCSRQSTSHSALTRQRFKIRRSRLLEDAFDQLSLLSEEDLKGPIRVSFINEHGEEEVGIDGGGIFKDFMENITRAAFDVQYGLFKETADHLLYPNPGSGLVHELHLQYFHFLGSLLGKAMYEGILVDLPFATFFLSKLKQKYNFLNDLPSLDPELYRHLLFLKHYNGDISELELYFVIVNNEYGEQCEEELLPGGRHMRVTNDNVITFIHLVANHRLNYQIRAQSTHFLRGFQQLIPKDWIDMFNEHEIQVLISGSLESLDIDDLRSNTNYSAGYHPDHELIEMFWEVLKSLSSDNQKKFLKFVTGCSRGPLLGFQYLEPKFCIQRAGVPGLEEHADRLPTSATCMNLLKLPPYKSKEQMQTKLLYAINSEAGFDLS
ncbi:E3 ubiquitin-protein ligase UPL6 [Zea mays]|uniref:HECT-type E3 ubiquitin transferase n=1 Tax=Zea mays TaxID=4577 RepID=A0A1D6LZ38_MAIZE|nr:E3 ubiquitin-protein ligase UPL6 [Zea mays]